MSYRTIKSASLILSVLALFAISSVTSFNMFSFGNDDSEVYNRPALKFPDAFEIGISSNDPGLNITEVVYFDNKQKKLRIQVFYSVLGLNPTKGLDIVLDEEEKMVAVQSEDDCKKTTFSESLLPIKLFFQMFESLTEYHGVDDDNLHIFKVKQLDITNELSPKFYFLFDQDMKLVKTRIEQTHIGYYDFDAVQQMKGRTFKRNDWYNAQCEQINEAVLQETSGFVSFMQQLAHHLIGSEDDILAFLGYDPKARAKTLAENDDESFSEE